MVELRKGGDIVVITADRPGAVDGLGPLSLDLQRLAETGKMGGFVVLRELHILSWGSEVNVSEIIGWFGNVEVLDVDGQLAKFGSGSSKEESVDDDLGCVGIGDEFLDVSYESTELFV